MATPPKSKRMAEAVLGKGTNSTNSRKGVHPSVHTYACIFIYLERKKQERERERAREDARESENERECASRSIILLGLYEDRCKRM